MTRDKYNIHLSSREIFVINNAFTAKRAYFNYSLGQIETQRNEARGKDEELFVNLSQKKKAILERQREVIKLQKKLNAIEREKEVPQTPPKSQNLAFRRKDKAFRMFRAVNLTIPKDVLAKYKILSFVRFSIHNNTSYEKSPAIPLVEYALTSKLCVHEKSPSCGNGLYNLFREGLGVRGSPQEDYYVH